MAKKAATALSLPSIVWTRLKNGDYSGVTPFGRWKIVSQKAHPGMFKGTSEAFQQSRARAPTGTWLLLPDPKRVGLFASTLGDAKEYAASLLDIMTFVKAQPQPRRRLHYK
jgi:hypothetical protein